MTIANSKKSSRELQAFNLLFYPERYPGLVKREPDNIKFLLWHNNVLGDYTSWSLFVLDTQYYVRRICWKQYTPYKLATPQTYGAENIFSKEVSTSIIEKFSSFELDNFKNKSKIPLISIDSSEFGILANPYKIHWMNEPPQELVELASWHKNTIAQFEALFS